MPHSRRHLVAGNWKMNGNSQLATQMVAALNGQSIDGVDILVCPPSLYLGDFKQADFSLGGQNLSEFASGAHTGEVSASMLLEAGCKYVLVGHSERRTDNHESNDLVAKKVEAALKNGLIPVLCVGEPESIREDGTYFDFISAQLDAVIELVGIAQFAHMVVAYEPVWAIGTGKTASPEQAQEVHKFIRDHIAKGDTDISQKLQILYGGSVKSANAKELFSQPDVDGGLIGGASLDPQEFLNICQAAKG
ncbi:triose-phosphate isomerase [Aliiglaciecola litoralis]|uniref:Triosephosphate isomerase n=1 Tax=Aliiglaciecola litoralis TaxID=582857 RepID=A0ABP3WW50_9ALTE